MKLICRFLIIIISFTVSFRAYCQREVKPTPISGVLVDSVTNEPLPFAAIFLKGSDKGTMTDENGKFEINTTVNFINVSVSLMGYNHKEVFVNKGESNNITIQLVPTGVALSELVVKPKKEKYSKKEKQDMIIRLTNEMKDAAKKLDFEKAMELRDIIFELESE